MTQSQRAIIEVTANAAYLVDMDASDVAFDDASVVYKIDTATYEVAHIVNARAINAAINTYDSAVAAL